MFSRRIVLIKKYDALTIGGENGASRDGKGWRVRNEKRNKWNEKEYEIHFHNATFFKIKRTI